MLKEGIKLFSESSNLENEHSKVMISSGIHKIENNIELKYKTGTFIPKEPWNSLSNYEKSVVWGDENHSEYDKYSFISIIKIPEEILEPFTDLRTALIEKKELNCIQKIKNQKNCHLGKELLKEYLTLYGTPFDEIFIGINPPNLRTVTYDPRDSHKKYIGLHLDNWHNRPLNERHFSPKRICINLGIEDRYFLYINLPLKKIYEELERVNSNDPRRFEVSSALGLAFMEEFSNYPILRLKISPNEGYIAPTENIIHDGSTSESTSFDISFHVHGEFNQKSKLYTK